MAGIEKNITTLNSISNVSSILERYPVQVVTKYIERKAISYTDWLNNVNIMYKTKEIIYQGKKINKIRNTIWHVFNERVKIYFKNEQRFHYSYWTYWKYNT